MPRLPSSLEPLFPVVKRAHRFATRRVGAVTRALAPGDHRAPVSFTRAVPRTAYLSSAEAASAESTVTLHPGGRAEVLQRPAPEGIPAAHPWWKSVTATTIPPRFVLEMEHGQVVGNYSAHVSADNVLDLETSPYYDIEGWREHPIFLRPRLPEASLVPGSLLSLSTRGTGVNYYHFVMDLLPRWAAYVEAFPGQRPDYLLADTTARYAQELLALVGLDDLPMLSPTKHSAFRADRLLVPSIGNVDTLGPAWNSAWLRETLPPSGRGALPSRIYVTRGSKRNSRRVVNEDSLVSILEPMGFSILDPGELSVQDQIDAFAAAEVVVAPHGAALTNLNFSPVGVRVLELFHPRYLNPGMWAIAANVPESRYRYLVGKPTEIRPPGAQMKAVFGDITVDLGEFHDVLTDLLR
ncbi:MAG: glycosyltransferase family 61 protein [Nocardioides sp.]|nr:glycosyltransferase family 61 protein [Nocardioides sp.]